VDVQVGRGCDGRAGEQDVAEEGDVVSGAWKERWEETCKNTKLVLPRCPPTTPVPLPCCRGGEDSASWKHLQLRGKRLGLKFLRPTYPELVHLFHNQVPWDMAATVANADEGVLSLRAGKTSKVPTGIGMQEKETPDMDPDAPKSWEEEERLAAIARGETIPLNDEDQDKGEKEAAAERARENAVLDSGPSLVINDEYDVLGDCSGQLGHCGIATTEHPYVHIVMGIRGRYISAVRSIASMRYGTREQVSFVLKMVHVRGCVGTGTLSNCHSQSRRLLLFHSCVRNGHTACVSRWLIIRVHFSSMLKRSTMRR
jgi:hypothetical protein